MSHSKELHWFYKPCNEVLHAKTPSHLHFTGKAFLYPFLAALKLYSPLYLVTHIIGRKSFQYLIKKTLPGIIRSSSFLSVYGGLFVAMQCTLVGLTHRAYRAYFFGSFFIAALISMFVEHPGRRKELAVYVFNVGIETIWRMLVDRGVVKPIKHSMGILFAVSWAVLSYYQKHKPECLNNVGAIVKFLNGEEGKPELLERKLSGHSLALLGQASQNDHVCPHRKHGTRCEVHWITNFSQSFLFGYGLKGLLALASNLLRIRAFNAKTMKDVLMKSFGKQQLRFGLFLGLLSALSRCIKCILRITRGKDDAINTLVAGFIAGLSSYLSSSLEISMYIFAKAIQTVFNHLTMLGKIKPLPYGAELLYSFFTALVFYAGLWEPHNVRPSYLSFLYKITGGLWQEYLTSNKPLREEFQSSAWTKQCSITQLMSDYVDARLDDNDPVRESDGYDISLEDQHYTFDRNFLEAFSTGWHSQAEVESMQPTPPEEKSWSKWSIMALWMGMVINIPSYMIGSAMVTGGLTWWEALLSVFIGNLVLLVPMILNGFPGVKYGIPFPVLLRSMFGFNGAKIAAIVRGLVGCGWFGIQTWIGGAAIYNFIAIFLPVIKSAPSMGEFQGINVAEFFCFWIFWIANMAIVFFGPEKIKILELASVPFLVLVPIGAFVWAWVSVGDFNQVLDASKQLGIEIETPQRVRLFFTSVTGVISGWVTMSLNIMDYTRYVKHQKDQIVGQVLGLPTTSLFLAALGIFITSATIVMYGKPLWNPVDIISEIDNGWLTAFGSVFIILATLSTNVAANLVSAANDVSNIWPRRITFRIGGVISGLISVLFLPWRLLASPNSFIFQWLIASASLMGGIGAVMIADYFVLRKGHLQIDDLYDSHGLYRFARGWNWRALVAVVVSVLPTVPGFLVVTGVLSEDSMPFWLAKLYDYTWFISFAIAFGLYLALSKLWKDVSYYEPEQRLNVDGIFDDMNTQGQSMQLEDVY